MKKDPGLSVTRRDSFPAETISQCSWAVVTVFVLATLCNVVLAHTGPHFSALVFLLAVVVAGLRWQRGPVLMMATLAALVWNFLFIHPRFTLHIADPQDAVMFALFFVVALSMGHLTTRLRERERAVRLHHRQQESLQAQKHRAQLQAESERLHRTLLDSVSHELKTPIAIIKTAVEGLGLASPYVVEIDTATRRLQRIVGNLLEITRVESSAVQPQPEWCELSDVLAATTQELQQELASHPLLITSPEESPSLKLDLRLLTQALSAVLHNATLYTPPGSRIQLEAHLAESILTISVRDHGPGIAPGTEEKIFQKFYRIPGSRAGGTGLGLAIAAALLKAMHGTIAARNHPEGGAEFVLTLPVGTRCD